MSLSLAVYFRPAEADAKLTNRPEEITDVARVIAECITILGVLGYILLQLGGEIVNIGFFSFLKQLSHEPAKFIFLISNLLILACIPCRLSGDRHAEDAILVVAVPGSWFLLMFFAGAVRLTGPFVTMVYSMITGDMLTFGIIYMVVLFGFSQSFYFLYKGFPGVKTTLYHSYHSTWMALFQITLGDYSYTDLSNTTYPNLCKTVFAIFMVLVPILLLNMLIAMMGNTYAHVIEQSEKEWMKQWAKIVVSLERAVSQKDAHNYLQEYSIKLGPGDDPNDPASEQRGVMVIKSKSKTRAKQRKGAVTNWKRVGKVTISELKKRGMTGEELRRIMWGRASISTPVRTRSPILEQPVPTIPSGFGDALTSALDVMTFAVDVPALTEGSPRPFQQRTPEASPNAMAPPPVNKTTPFVPASVPVSTTATTTAFLPSSSSATYSQDPLLDLMIATEDPVCDEETLLRLARSARLVGENVPAVANAEIDPGFLERLALVGNLGLGAPPEHPTKAPEPRRRQYFLESSDNDICANESQLGVEARLRRIRSASSRLASAFRRKSRQRVTGARQGSSSSSSTSSIDNVSGGRPVVNEPEVHKKPATTSAGHSSSATVEEEESKASNSGKIQRKRPKTGRNRISPKETNEIPERMESTERDKSVPPGSPSLANADPLEPWSTSSIKDMNAILAWKDSDPDSP